MGLDMYLNKRTYVGANYKHRKITGKIELFKGDEKEPIKISFNKVSEIIEQVAYWRKSNQIHNWFVENIQDGVDDCGEYYVPYDKLLELKELCEKVKKIFINIPLIEKEITPPYGNKYMHEVFDIDQSKLEELLPTKSGFFFGATHYDEYYLEEVKNTIEQLDNLDEDRDYYYTSSW